MDEFEGEVAESEVAAGDDADARESEAAQVNKILKSIKSDKKAHGDAFKQMKADMYLARTGHDKDWSEDNYTANIVGRHVKQKVGALYAKNPRLSPGAATRWISSCGTRTPPR